MKKRRFWIGAASLVILAGIGLAAFFIRWDLTTYDGKTVAQWLELLDSGSSQEKEKARDAIALLGTNAVPTLRSYIEARDSWLKKKLIALSKKQSLVNLKLKSADDLHRMARNGYGALGPLAIPKLIEILDDPQLIYSDNPAYEASRVLSGAGAAAVPALIDALTNSSPFVRYHACFCLGWYESLQSDSAVAPLAERMKDSEWTVRCRAAIALSSLGRNAEISVPALARGVGDPDSAVRFNSAYGLAAFGEKAEPAVPQLSSALQQENNLPERPSKRGPISSKSRQEVITAIKKALLKIELEKNGSKNAITTADPKLQRFIGQSVTLRGRFELAGKPGPYISRTGEPVYLVPRGPFSWSSDYEQMQGKMVNIIGTLQYRHFERTSTNELVAQPSDYFYFDVESVSVILE